MDTLWHQVLEHRSDLTLRVDDERRAHPIGRCLNDRAHHREHDGGRFARPGLAQGEEMAGKELAGHVAMGREQQTPLWDLKPPVPGNGL